MDNIVRGVSKKGKIAELSVIREGLKTDLTVKFYLKHRVYGDHSETKYCCHVLSDELVQGLIICQSAIFIKQKY